MAKKVFELAKELGIGPLDLVEQLKTKGFSVRNHMAELSDEDVSKFMSLISTANEEKVEVEVKKKVVRKKTVEPKEQKVAVKTTTKQAVEKSADSSTTSEKSVTLETKKSAGSVVKKKATVIRRKSDEKDSDYENHDEDSLSTQTFEEKFSSNEEEQQLDGQDLQSDSSDETIKTDSVKTSGLRVVSKAPQKPVASSAAEESRALPEKKVTGEKTHRFTPVYIPSKDPAHVEREANLNRAVKSVNLDSQEDMEDDDDLSKKKLDDDSSNKKRMGGLASMMTGKKAITSKSQAINMTRAEDEIKSYAAALSGTGRPIYTQIMRKNDYMGPTKQTEITEVKESKRVVQIFKGVELGELAKKLSVKFKDLVDKCLDLNLLVKETDYVGLKLAQDICSLYNYRVENKAFDEDKIIGKKVETTDEKAKYPVRPPVVAIMGHVDHGKTTLLDTIRKAKVADGEAGGITQHIGAYSVKTNDGKTISFLDTPGHAAFAAMRQRGANATDIVILVVAGDDGVMPQTKESIKYCANAEVPIIVAVNKMDKPGANPDRVKQELTEFNLMPEDWGGQTQYVHVSALKGQGIDELLEAILLQAEILDLRANPKGNVEGIVIESKIEAGRGPMATILIQEGTLNKGDSIVVGETHGRARSLTDHTGTNLNSAGPSTPVQIFGLEGCPTPGDKLNVVKNEREAKKIAENRINERKLLVAAPEKKKTSLEDFFAASSGKGEEQKVLNLIIRSDVQGSYEAIKSALETLGNSEVTVKVIGGGVGPITDSDVNLASASTGFIIGFNMRPVTTARKMAEDKGVDIKNYSVIYELINDVKLALEGLLDPEFVEEFIGRAEVREVFNIPKAGVIAGSYVIDGKIASGCSIRLLRNGKIIHDGKMSSLKRFKDDAKEVKNGYECGIALENYTDIKSQDIFEAYMMVQKKRTLDDVAGFTTSGSKEQRPVL